MVLNIKLRSAIALAHGISFQPFHCDKFHNEALPQKSGSRTFLPLDITKDCIDSIIVWKS